ncbi:N-acetyltransferase esco2 [Mortierella polycephala]|uniref:N-acetyltransferase esco2 n=1 Tax=Mortierella polycephala TaxID=41804 RepID=A0A9P6Q369_9FUNG|nr:N-acetyltransferase esco2 [Mortierella polycephala]
MNTPASSSLSSAESNQTSSPGPETPQREYKFHKAVRNTYGRARSRIDSPSSPDPWSVCSTPTSTSTSACNSPVQPSQGRTRLSASFADLATLYTTPTRIANRTFAEKLAQAKLELDNKSDDDLQGGAKEQKNRGKDRDDRGDNDKDPNNIFHVRATNETSPPLIQQGCRDLKEDGSDVETHDQGRSPLKRKRRIVEVLVPPLKSPRRRKMEQEQEQDGDIDQEDYSSTKSRPGSPLSPPASPIQRSRIKAGTVNQTIHQATISSFFTTKAGKGTGIFKGKTVAVNSKNTSNDSLSMSVSNNKSSSTASKPEPPKKLEQLFLAFSKDRTKSTPRSTASTPQQSSSSSSLPTPSSSAKNSLQSTSTRKPTRLQRESEKSKRYHCLQCGMPYVRGQPEDEQIHDRYHRAAVGGIDYPGYKNEVVVARYNDQDFDQLHGRGSSNGSNGDAHGSFAETSSSRIVMVSMSDTGTTTSGSSFEKKKVKEVLKLVNKELGSVEFDPEQLESCKVFLYISGMKKVVGCVITERIKQGFEIMLIGDDDSTTSAISVDAACSGSSDSSSSSSSIVAGFGVETTPTRGTKIVTGASSSVEQEGSAIFCSTVPQPAICGINRIWVSALYRRHKVASRMLDAVRDRFIYACKLERKDLAFSQPTGDGKSLARQYLGTDKFLVYVE